MAGDSNSAMLGHIESKLLIEFFLIRNARRRAFSVKWSDLKPTLYSACFGKKWSVYDSIRELRLVDNIKTVYQ